MYNEMKKMELRFGTIEAIDRRGSTLERGGECAILRR